MTASSCHGGRGAGLALDRSQAEARAVELGQDIHRGAGYSAASSSAGAGLAGYDSQAGGLQVGGLLGQEVDGGDILPLVELGRSNSGRTPSAG